MTQFLLHIRPTICRNCGSASRSSELFAIQLHRSHRCLIPAPEPPSERAQIDAIVLPTRRTWLCHECFEGSPQTEAEEARAWAETLRRKSRSALEERSASPSSPSSLSKKECLDDIA